MTNGVLLQSLANGTLFNNVTVEARGQTVNAIEPAVGVSVSVWQHQVGYDPSTQYEPVNRVQVYSDEELTIPVGQPLTTDGTGAVPGYVAGGQTVDLLCSGGVYPFPVVFVVQAALPATGSNPTLSGDVTGPLGSTEVVTVLDGQVPATATNLTVEATARTEADTAIAGTVTAEATARATADTALAASVTAEAAARGSADTTLAGEISTEATARAAGDAALATEVAGKAAAVTGPVSGAIVETDGAGQLSASTVAASAVSTIVAAFAAGLLIEVEAPSSNANQYVGSGNAVYAAPPVATLVDAFATPGALSSEWETFTAVGSAPTIATEGQVTSTGAYPTVVAALYVGGEANDCEFSTTMPAEGSTSDYAALYLRVSSPTSLTGYRLKIGEENDFVQIYNAQTGAALTATQSVTLAAGDGIMARATGPVIAFWHQPGGTGPWVEVLSVTDATFTTGYAGFALTSNAIALGEFSYGPIISMSGAAWQNFPTVTVSEAAVGVQGIVGLNYPSNTPTAPTALGLNTPMSDLLRNGPMPVPATVALLPTVKSIQAIKSSYANGIPAGAFEQSDPLSLINTDYEHTLLFKFEGSEPATVVLYFSADCLTWTAMTDPIAAAYDGFDWSISIERAVKHGYYQIGLTNGATVNGNTVLGTPAGWSLWAIATMVG